MGIVSIKRDWGAGLSILRIVTTDNFDTVFADGYLTAQKPIINLLNGGDFDFFGTDYVLVDYQTGWSFASLSSDYSTLIPPSTGSISGFGEENQVAVFSAMSTIGGSVNFTFDVVNNIMNQGLGNSFIQTGPNTLANLFQVGDDNVLFANNNGTLQQIYQFGSENSFDVSSTDTTGSGVNIFQSGIANAIAYGVESITGQNIFQYGFGNTIAPNAANTLDHILQVGFGNQNIANISFHNTQLGENNFFLDSTGANFITESTCIGYGNSIDSSDNTITGAMAYGYQTTVTGNFATAMGYQATPIHTGSFTLMDHSSGTPVSDTVANEWVSRFVGGYSFLGAAATFQGGVILSTMAPTEVAFSNGSNVLSGSPNLTWDGTTFSVQGGVTAAVSFTSQAGGLFCPNPGYFASVKTGANCKLALASMSAGTAVVTNTTVTSNSFIMPFSNDTGVSAIFNVTNIIPGTGFTINGSGNGVVGYLIMEGI